MSDFRIEWFDEELNTKIQHHVWAKRGRYYEQYDFEDGRPSTRVRRISEKAFISAYESYIDA